jgi:enoyl-CoA hydratase
MFDLKIENYIGYINFNRPEKANAINKEGWGNLKEVFEQLDLNDTIRVIILHGGESKHFCAGIDLELLMSISQETIKCQGRKNEKLRRTILELQAPINAIENCSKPVIAAIHGGCIGGGVDIVAACDMRYCTEDSFFTIKEIDMGMVADLGTLQRLPKIIGEGKMRELAYTGRKMDGKEAEKIGLVNDSLSTKEALMAHVTKIATDIASKAPLAIRGTKHILLYTRDHSVADGLNYMATWNAGMLVSNDLMEAFASKMQNREAKFD